MTTVSLTRHESVCRVSFSSDNGIQIFSRETRQQLADSIDELHRLDDCRVVVFEATGRTFIAGADIRELGELDAETAAELARNGQQLMQQIADLDAVTIAAIHAACAGGGCELALACDLRMGATGLKIGLPEVGLGVLPGWGGTVRAVRLFGGAAARRIILNGELLNADEALRLGVVDSVHENEVFGAAVDKRIESLLSRGPTACREVKRLIASYEGPEIESQLEAEAAAFARCVKSGEAAEGTTAFLEKRPPDFG